MTQYPQLLSLLTQNLWPMQGGITTCSIPVKHFWQRLRDERCGAQADRHSALLAVMTHAATFVDLDSPHLTAVERGRAERYQSLDRRRAFITGRTLLRNLLFDGDRGGRVDLDLDLHFNEYGKPLAHGGVHFNLSHTTGYSGLAIDPLSPIGFDVESSGRPHDFRELVRMFAHPAEAQLLHAAPDAVLAPLFLRCWTRKEALLKALGYGLSCPPSSIDTRLDEPFPEIEAYGRWRLIDISLDYLGLVAALAVRLNVERVRLCVICEGEVSMTVLRNNPHYTNPRGVHLLDEKTRNGI